MKYFKPPNVVNQLPNKCNIFSNWFAILKLLTQCDKMCPHVSIVETVVDFKTLKPVSFQLSILQYVSSSFSRSTKVYFGLERIRKNYLCVCKVSTGAF